MKQNMDLVFKFSMEREQMLDNRAGSLAIAKACLQLYKHRRFRGCENDFACFLDALLLLIDVHAKQVFNADSNIAKSEEMFKESKLFVKERSTVVSNKKVNS